MLTCVYTLKPCKFAGQDQNFCKLRQKTMMNFNNLSLVQYFIMLSSSKCLGRNCCSSVQVQGDYFESFISLKFMIVNLFSGPTSSLIIHNLQSLPHLKNAFDIQVWEKDRRVGGRFLTFQSPTSSSYGDLGAQYLTSSGLSFSQPYFKGSS